MGGGIPQIRINENKMTNKIKRIKIREKHSLNLMKKIIRKNKPEVLILESVRPKWNNKTINISQGLTLRYGWEKINTKFITKHAYDKRKHQKRALNMVQVMLKSRDSTDSISPMSDIYDPETGRELIDR